jgi:hypothetical protein
MSAAISLTKGSLQILLNSVSQTMPNPGQVSPAIGLLVMVGYVAVVLVAGAFMFVTRDA